MAGGSKLFLSFIEKQECVATLALLEGKPAFMNLGHGDQAWCLSSFSGSTCRCNVKDSLFIVTLFPMRASFPEISEKNQVLGQKILSGAKDKIQRGDGRLGVFPGEASKRLCHFESEEIKQRELSSIYVGGVAEDIEERKVPIAEVRPLCQTQEKGDGFGSLEVKLAGPA